MAGERVRWQGVVHIAVGVVLVAWVVVAAATVEVGNPGVLLGAAVTAGIMCLVAVAAGVVATRVVDVASAMRLRHVFVVLEGVAMAVFYPSFWAAFGLETSAGDVGIGGALVLVVPAVVALLLTLRLSVAVHRIVTDVNGPIVTGTGEGAPAQWIRVLGTVLIVVGSVLTLAVVPVTLAAHSPEARVFSLVVGVAFALVPVVLGVRLARVTDVYSARRINTPAYFAVTGGSGVGVTNLGFVSSTVSGGLFRALMFGVLVLLVIAALVTREYTGVFDRPWRGRARGRDRKEVSR